MAIRSGFRYSEKHPIQRLLCHRMMLMVRQIESFVGLGKPDVVAHVLLEVMMVEVYFVKRGKFIGIKKMLSPMGVFFPTVGMYGSPAKLRIAQ